MRAKLAGTQSWASVLCYPTLSSCSRRALPCRRACACGGDVGILAKQRDCGWHGRADQHQVSNGAERRQECHPGGRVSLFKSWSALLPVAAAAQWYGWKGMFCHVLPVTCRYLVSYEHMGLLSIHCMSGCQCEGLDDISGMHVHRTSVTLFKYFPASQHEQCRLKVKSKHDNEGGGDKVRIDALMVASSVSEDPGLSKWMNFLAPEKNLLVGGA